MCTKRKSIPFAAGVSSWAQTTRSRSKACNSVVESKRSRSERMNSWGRKVEAVRADMESISGRSQRGKREGAQVLDFDSSVNFHTHSTLSRHDRYKTRKEGSRAVATLATDVLRGCDEHHPTNIRRSRLT